MSSIIYLSYPINEKTPLYGNNSGIRLTKAQSQSSGDSCNTMIFEFPSHTGTHIDTPRHFSQKGFPLTDIKPDFWLFNHIEFIDLSRLVADQQIIKPDILPDFSTDNPELVLFYTGYGKYRGTGRYTLNAPGFSESLYYWLKKHYPSVRCIGMDLISISSYTNRAEGRRAHKAFLNPENDFPILIIEDMNLEFKGKLEQVIVAPLMVSEADGSPCTVLAWI